MNKSFAAIAAAITIAWASPAIAQSAPASAGDVAFRETGRNEHDCLCGKLHPCGGAYGRAVARGGGRRF